MIAILRNVSKRYGRPVPVNALGNLTVSFPCVKRLMIVGESGSGKSTLARCLAGWEAPDEGSIELFCAAKPQLVPQEPAASLNPRWSALEIVAEPYRISGMSKTEAQRLASGWLHRMELPANSFAKVSSTFSGGEQARLAIARGLAAVNPQADARAGVGLLIFDESFSALDEPLRIRLLELLCALQDTLPVLYMFLSHDLAITAAYADFVAVMEDGQVVEQGTAAQVLDSPLSDAMRQLLAESKDMA